MIEMEEELRKWWWWLLEDGCVVMMMKERLPIEEKGVRVQLHTQYDADATTASS